MEKKNFFKDVYDDFFGIEKLEKENEKLSEKLGLLNAEVPEIIVEKNEQTQENKLTETELKQLKDSKMEEAFRSIDNLYIEDESKNILKKMIEYMRKYYEKIEKQYIPFNFCVYSDDKNTINNVVNVMASMAVFFEYVKWGEAIESSMLNLEKIDDLSQIFSNKNAVILLKDFEAFNSREKSFVNQFWYNLEEKIKEPQTFMTILGAKKKETLNLAFEGNENIKQNWFNFEIVAKRPEVQDIYQETLERLKQDNEISEKVSIKLLDYITITYPNSNTSYSEYIDRLCEKILFSKDAKIEEKDIPEYEKEKTTDEVFAELNELVGLEKVKQALQDLVSLIELKKKSEGDLKIKDTNLHMVFLGNPGTGKTTVARIVAQILYNLKYIKQNKLIEVSSKDLVAEYVGQTAPKTMAVIEKALGGVLFIDEAYSLASGNGQGNSYNEEAIATLIQAMENYRDNLVVIFAGYTKEMQAFLDANSGIVSRIGYTMEFEDYTEEQLLQIFRGMISKSGFILTELAEKRVLEIIAEYKDTKNFGNARFVRNLYEKTIIKHASNTRNKKSKKVLKTIEEKDISVENLLKM